MCEREKNGPISSPFGEKAFPEIEQPGEKSLPLTFVGQNTMKVALLIRIRVDLGELGFCAGCSVLAPGVLFQDFSEHCVKTNGSWNGKGDS